MQPPDRSDSPVPYPWSYWVVPGWLLAGEYPGDYDPPNESYKLGRLIDAGIRQVISLMAADEVDRPGKADTPAYEPRLNELAEQRGVSVAVRRFPVQDLGVPAPDLMRAVLDAIDEAIARGNPVYVHCWGGVGRTGTVVGCYLIRHGMANSEDVIDQIQRLRTTDKKAHRLSPENETQRDFVRAWPRHESL
ncbi:MAG: protein-tyrosine phosphatase family protein [Thermodesulfobacteriota bacterium]